MCHVVEFIMFIVGLYALIAGKIKVSESFYLEGWRARIAGLFLIAPLLLAILASLIIGLLIANGLIQPSVMNCETFIEFLLIDGALLGVIIYALIVKPRKGTVLLEKGRDLEE